MKIKLQEKLIALLLVFAMVFLTVPLAKADIIISLEENEETDNIGVAVANAGQTRTYSFDVWYSNGNNIAYWPTIPCANYTNLTSRYDLGNDMLNAKNGWSNALGIYLSISRQNPTIGDNGWYSDSNYPLHFYSGDSNSLNQLRVFPESKVDSSSILGHTTYVSYNTYPGGILQDGSYRNYWKLYKVRCFVKDDISQYTHVTAHEFGHALGWQGHSTSSTDLMYPNPNGVTTPQTRDRLHLKQIYDLFH